MRKLILFLAAVSLVLFAEKALCYETRFSIEPESFNFFRYEEIREQEAAPTIEYDDCGISSSSPGRLARKASEADEVRGTHG